MDSPMSDFIALGILFAFIAVVVYCQAPREYQTIGGFALILACAPVSLIVIFTLLAQPALLIPAVFVLGIGCAHRG